MGVRDRFYMREGYHPPSVSTRLIIVLIVAFVLQSALLFYGGVDINRHLALSRDGLVHGKVWQLLTFQFLHSTPWPWHVLFNCLGIFFFGRRVEEALGGRKFLGLYLLSGVIGGVLQVLLTFIPRHLDAPVVGASAGVCGLIGIFCSMHPMEEMQMWIYFFPIRIRAHWFLKFLLFFSAFGALIPFDNVAHGAHLGGVLLGMSYVRNSSIWDRLLSRWRWPNARPKRPRAGSLARHVPWSDGHMRDRSDSGTFISREVDPILDKISAKGFGALTEEERKILDTARKMMK
jgi:membrane associated rhomboid family serine protease